MILEWFIPIQNESSNIGDIFSIVFGVSSGILTLVGLIAVFTSLISQQIVEKLRAEWWNLHEVSDEAQSLLSDIEQGHFDKSLLKDLSVRLNRALWKYKRVYSDKSLFMNLVVILGIISLFFVGSLWIWVYSYIKNTVTLSDQEDKIILVTVGVGCFILFLFILILIGLINHKHLNKFPTPEAFYDVNKNKHTQTNTFAFIFISARLRIFDAHNSDKYELGLDFKFPW